MKRKKWMVAAMMVAGVVLLSAQACAGYYYPIYVNGQQTDLAGETQNGVTRIGLRALVEKLGLNVDFKNGKILVSNPEKSDVKITTLAENKNEGHQQLQNEFGFSAVIETGSDTIIFDTGKAGQFIENAKKLNIDLEDSNTMVLSHAHYDHCGGVMDYYTTYGTENKTLYVKDCFFENANSKYYYDAVGQKFDFTNGTKGYFPVGIQFTQQDLIQKGVAIEYLDGNSIKVADGVTVYGNFIKNEGDKLAPNMLDKNEKGEYMVDDFDDEVAVAVETDQGLIIVSGCSHSGILNIVDTIEKRSGEKVYAVIGGFHLLDASEEKIQSIIDRFKAMGIEKIGLSHCTGPKATAMFLEQMPDQTFVNETGSVVEVK